MKKHLYYFNWQLELELSATVMDDLLEQDDSEQEIYFLSCNGCMKPCWTNRTSVESKCTKCRFIKQASFGHLNKKIHHLYIDDYITENETDRIFSEMNYTYNSVEEIKEITYKGAMIGFGALSTYISFSRNREPVMDAEFRSYFDQLLRQGVLLKEVIDKVIDEINPDVISIFNGRTADVRSVYDTAIQNSIPLRGIENIIYNPPENRKDMFYDAIPQSIEYHINRTLELWENSPLSFEEKAEIAARFYEGRRGGKLVRDSKVYVAEQKEGLMPDNWDPTRRNIALFNSSEDEIAAIPEYDELALFSSQEEGIHYILEHIDDPEIHFYLRIHPNLKDIKYGYHRRLLNLEEKYDNVTVIPGHSPVSTYRLMDEAEKVLVFGSTMGAEASYWGKPVVTIHGSYYYHLNVGYIPDSKEHLLSLITDHLEPKDRIGAIQYGYYQIDFIRYTTPLNVVPKDVEIFGRKIGTVLPHLKWMGSAHLFKLYSYVRFQVLKKLKSMFKSEKELTIPKKGY